ncbi:MAG TPA: hypothetical protein DCP90_05575 [Clostridiales bacterium]|nr:MAG: hypothetical protein A2Y22_04340 [Clostridiales bacterium GWD2_32_59]HAN10071.1 hypothetical protein [Clostridiales bacterium]
MNVVIINVSNVDNLNKIVGLCQIALEDMGVKVIKVDLNENTDILQVIKGVEGIIISTDMRMNNIPAKLQAFFELFEDTNKNSLKNIPVLPIIISGKYNTLDGYKLILNNLIQLECIETGKIINSAQNMKKSYMEDQIKNFYEYIKNNGGEVTKAIEEPKNSEVKKVKHISPEKQVKIKKEDDIMELTELFSKQLSQKIGTDMRSLVQNDKAVFENEITVKQMTKNLVHYFQPQLALDVNSIYQLNITGDEDFSCNLAIKSKDCAYNEGELEKADVIINVDSGMWKLILIGSISAQKAFMTGKIKVKGDFMLLSKFDKIFKKM